MYEHLDPSLLMAGAERYHHEPCWRAVISEMTTAGPVPRLESEAVFLDEGEAVRAATSELMRLRSLGMKQAAQEVSDGL